MILMLLVSGCVADNATSGDALCDGTAAARDTLADRLISEGVPDDVLTAGADLILLLDSGC